MIWVSKTISFTKRTHQLNNDLFVVYHTTTDKNDFVLCLVEHNVRQNQFKKQQLIT